ncbi:unnamed protein product [Knipowitschia caucasica]|uniref:Uncharacterized protein n=1 Tax=Knipowitschia caucasica TaxID=637954 RepID=A0AAV2MAX0_KNICA
MHDSSLKPRKNGSDSGNPVLSLDLSRKIHSGICKCKVNGRWERHPCPCSKFLRRKNRRGKIRKLCKKMKHLKKCQQRNHVPIIPF